MTNEQRSEVLDILNIGIEKVGTMSNFEKRMFDTLYVVYGDLVEKEKLIYECLQIAMRMDKVLK